MKVLATLTVILTLGLANASFAANTQVLKAAGKATGKFALKKAMVPVTIFTIAQDAKAACERNGCTEKMTVGKGAEIAGAVVHTQLVETKDAAYGAVELFKALVEVTEKIMEK